MSGDVLVTGGTGKTGRRLAAALNARGARARIASRRPAGADSVAFDWTAEDTWGPALQGTGAAYLLPPMVSPEIIAAAIRFSRTAIDSGCRRLVLLSASLLPAGGPGHGQIHAWLAENAPEWAVLRPSWFMQNFSEGQLLGPIRNEGAVYTAAGDGRVAFVSADDIAACAAACLTAREAPNRDAILTGPRALTYDEAAALVGQAAGRPVIHRRISAEDLAARHVANGLTPAGAQGLAMMDMAIAAGAEDRITGEVERLTGRLPIAFEDFVRTEAKAWAA